ncbi:MAG TPA: hypothetical protein VFM19_09185, partial [Candidatus Limnocylindria bacterium]|nr:hypothetical protein [Candidatus Limnocylindria bacterium]
HVAAEGVQTEVSAPGSSSGVDTPPGGGAAGAPTTPSEPVASPATESGPTQTRWDRRSMGERRRPSTAEQAVPWLIGIVLALAGIVIVLVALIFTAENGLLGEPSPSPSTRTSGLVPIISPGASRPVTGSASPRATEASSPSAAPSTPTYGALEMLYLSRATASAPIYLYRRDFSVDEEPETLARADQGIEQYAWAPDGRRGVAIISGRAVALQEDTAARPLIEGVSEVAFGNDSRTVYAARVARDGANDAAQVVAIDWQSGEQEIIGSVTFPHPEVAAESALEEAQFIDDGGLVRLYPTIDGRILLWVLGAPATYAIDPETAEVTETTGLPLLSSPDDLFRITLSESAAGGTLILTDADGNQRASTLAPGLVSHMRWAPNGSEVAFTLGTQGANGGIVQNLYVWDLVDGKAPTMITSNGASFGAEWRGAAVRWVHEPAS